MKVLLVCPYFFPKIGGLENYAFSVAKGLIAAGHKVVVVTSNSESDSEIIRSVVGIKIIGLPVKLNISNTPLNFRWLKDIKRIIKEEAPDIINAHSPVPGIADVAFMAKGRTPFVITYHSGSMKKGKFPIDLLLGLYERFVLKYILLHSSNVISVYPSFIDSITKGKIAPNFIPPGVDLNLFRPQVNPKMSKTVLYVGRIELSSNWKGIDDLVAAFTEVLKTHPDAVLELVGNGDAVDTYKAMAAANHITSHVKFTGPLRGKKLVEAYQRANVVVLPSKTDAESFGIVLIEAMATETPVIGSNIGGIPNVIEDQQTGFLVTPNNSSQLADKINDIFSNPAMAKKLGKQGRKRVKMHFDISNLTSKSCSTLERHALPEVLHVVSNYPPRLGGMEQVVKALATEQVAQGYSVKVITSNMGAKHPIDDKGINVIRLKSFELAHTPIIPSLLFKITRASKSTVIHLHVAQALTPEIVMLASKLRGIKYIAHLHLDVAPSGKAGVLLKLYKPLILRWVLKSADAVVVFNDEQRSESIKRYGLDIQKVRVIRNGVGDEFYNHKPRTMHSKRRLLFVGRLSSQKNVGMLLRSLVGISDRFSTNIVGDGELKDSLRALARNLKLKNVHFSGRRNGRELISDYEAADVFVLTSEREGMPLVLLEAMAQGMPIIATNVPGIKEIVMDGENGILVDYGNVETLREAIIKLCGDADLYTQFSTNAALLSKNYSWNDVASDFAKLYKEVMSK